MDNIIRELVGIEALAKEVTQKIEQDKIDMRTNIEKRRKEIEADIEEETKRKIQQIKISASDEAKEKISEITLETKMKVSNLEQEFNSNKDRLKAEILNSIIGR